MAQSVLELTNTPYEMQCVDLFANEHKEEWFEKLNKKKQVPVLVDGDFVVTESTVIMKYICNKIGDTTLYPTDPKLRTGILTESSATYVHWMYRGCHISLMAELALNFLDL